MKVLMINGSPHRKDGNDTGLLWRRWKRSFMPEGVETEIIQIGGQDIRGCVACNGCAAKRQMRLLRTW